MRPADGSECPHVLTALIDTMGGPEEVNLWRHVAHIDMDDWKEALKEVRVTPPVQEGQEPQPPRALRPGEKGHCLAFRRIARLRMGEAAGEDPVLLAPAPLPAMSQPEPEQPKPEPAKVAKTPARKLKMSTLFDQADDTEITPWTAEHGREVMAEYVLANGGLQPHPSEKASLNQLAALESRLQSGDTPCADFAVWRPHGPRLERRLRLTIHHRTPLGEWVPHEVAGPAAFEDWFDAWRVFAFAMRALKAATQPRMQLYEMRMREFHSAYGPKLWWLLAQADQRMRGEQCPIIRETLEREHIAAKAKGDPHDLDEIAP